MTERIVFEPPAFATADEAAKACPIPLPPEAMNVRVARYSEWIAYDRFVRFEAPVEVCLRHATVIVPGEPLTQVSDEQLSEDARPPDPGIFRDLTWFDLSAARNVTSVGARGGPRQVWVDQERGVFYFRAHD